MFIANLSEIRSNRQNTTCLNLAEQLSYGELDSRILKKLINFKSFDRLCDLMGCSRQDIYKKCQEDYSFSLAVAHGCCIRSSRQGSKDELFILKGLDNELKKYGVSVRSLGVDEVRPTRDGKLLSKEDFKASGLTKMECLKSLDGKVEGTLNGWIFAKVVLGSGGHQDSVFHEASEFGKWSQKFGASDQKHIILIDTDRQKSYNDLKSKFDSDDIWVVDHLEFQQRVQAYV